MKYKCIKSDPLGWIETGKVYELRRMGNTYIVCGEGFAISKHIINEYFERVTEPEDNPRPEPRAGRFS